MKVWCWWNRRRDAVCFNTVKPEHFPDGNFHSGIRPGEYQGNIDTYCVMLFELRDILDHLPKPGELAQVWFHELWGHAKDFPSYDKEMWKNLQHAVEFKGV